MACYVQLGAGAGDSDASINYRDGFSSYVKSRNLSPEDKVVVVEANTHNLEALKLSWANFSNVSVFQFAICSKEHITNETIEMFYSLDDGPHFTISSTFREHVEKFYKESSIRSFSVPCLDINSFLKQTCSGSPIELLATDIEGMDVPVLNDLDLSIFDIHKISFEKSHGENDLKNLIEKLKSAGYHKSGTGMDPHNSDVLWTKPKNFRERFVIYVINLKHNCWEIQIPARHFIKTKLNKLRDSKR
jgi:FkbM family methyltransferase